MLAREIEFKTKAGNSWSDTWKTYDPSKIVFTNNVNIAISKVDAQNSNYAVSGAELALYDSRNRLVNTAWTTDGTKKFFENIVVDEVYTLKENKAPFGYEKSDNINFKVVYEGNKYVLKVNRNDGAGYVNAVDNNIVMTDSHKTFKIGKQDVGGKYINNATLKVSKKYGGDIVVAPWTSSSTEPKEIDVIAVGMEKDVVYVLTEETAPYGYTIAESIEFKIIDGNKVVARPYDSNEAFKAVAHDEILMVDDYETMSISKIDMGGNPIDDAKLVITKPDGTVVIDEWKSSSKDSKQINIVNFEKDTVYILTETTAPYGYEIAESIEFMIDDNNVVSRRNQGSTDDFAPATDRTLIMQDKHSLLYISKHDVGGEPIDAAKLVITKDTPDGTVVIPEWESDKTNAKEINVLDDGLEKNTVYVLTEKTAPFGYEQAESIEFKITDENKILVRKYGVDEAFKELSSNEIIMEDAHKILEFSKVDVGGEPIDDAKLIITEGKPDGNVIVPEWSSKKDSTEKIDLLKYGFKEDVVYVLTEKTAPFGYEKAESIEFKITGDNKVYTRKYGSNDEFSLVTKDVITMEDAHKSFVVKKVDEAGNTLGGAKLSIADYLNREVTSWTTVAGEAKTIDIAANGFKANTVYKLKEDKAPAGYEKADEILFMFDADCNLFVKVSDEYVPQAEGGIIVMVDKEEKATTTELTTTEEVTTEEITSEEDNTEDEDVIEEDTDEEDDTEDDNELTEDNDKVNDNDSISTGDNSHVDTVFIVMLMSLAGVICVLIKKREQEKR